VTHPQATDSPPIPFEAARDALLATVAPLPPERVPAADAAGRVLAADVVAPEDLPRFALSAMDGYAIPADVLHALVSAGRVQARVAGEIAAGSPEPSDTPAAGEVLRIFTGGMVPAWAAAIVMQEQADASGDRVGLRGPVRQGLYIRPAGGDVRAGATVLRAGGRIHPPDLALLAALGVAEVSVGHRPRVGVISTGAELSDDAQPRPGQIRDSNGPMLEAAARACGAREVLRARTGDSASEIEAAAQRMLGQVDVLCVSGGVSVGDHDLVQDAFAALGVTRVFWRVAQRPGKPLYFGTWRATPVFGLPGNPASSLAAFLTFVWPALRRLEGAQPTIVSRRARLAVAVSKGRGLTVFLRGRTLPGSVEMQVEPSGDQDSHLLHSFARADCLIVCPAAAETLASGCEVDILPFPWTQR